jgi:hypothetical protein
MKIFQENQPAKKTLIISIVALFLAIPPIFPYAYYQLLRWLVCGTAAYGALLLFKEKKNSFAWVFVAIAILFNPIAPIFLDKGAWVVIDGITALIFSFCLYKSKKQFFQHTPTKLCPFCKKTVDVSDAVCPHCERTLFERVSQGGISHVQAKTKKEIWWNVVSSVRTKWSDWRNARKPKKSESLWEKEMKRAAFVEELTRNDSSRSNGLFDTDTAALYVAIALTALFFQVLKSFLDVP